MAAYASLVSLLHIIQQTQQHPPPPLPIFLHQTHFLKEKATFLQHFLEYYSHGGRTDEADGLKNRIADAACAAEYIIESGIVDLIRAGSTSHGQMSRSVDLYEEDLRKVIDDMDSIIQEINGNTTTQVQPQADLRAADPRRSSPTEQNIMVGFDDELNEVLHNIVAHESRLQIIPIVGMGGIGKTTLTKNVYAHPLVQQHFDLCAWATISQEYSTREILREILRQVNKEGKGDFVDSTEDELGLALYRYLWGRRYLIILDDMWHIEVWERIKFFFPDTHNVGSRIIVTTRLSELAAKLTGSYRLQMSFLDPIKSWDLFCQIVFAGEGCPLGLREAAKKIVNGCKGLPLSIVVVGGLLARFEPQQSNWERVAQNLNSVVNLEDDDRCFSILYMSYNHLPVHLKPCFLYMGVFPEDEVIQVSMLIKLWVAEGFLKPIDGKSMELVAEEYLKDLVDRNLILVQKLGSTGNIKHCNIHDLLRDLCLREARNERFYTVINQPGADIQQGVKDSVRIVLSEENLNNLVPSAERARTLICCSGEAPLLKKSPLLRVWKTFDKDLCDGDLRFPGNMSHLVNLRYVAVTAEGGSEFSLSVGGFRNLHTLIVNQVWGGARASEIWKMPQFRHVQFDELELADPTSDGNDPIVLENLQTLLKVRNFRCSKEVVKRIPNVKKLIVFYDNLEGNSDYSLHNVRRLSKLESFGCFFSPRGSYFSQTLTFPNSLKKLTISHFDWEEMLDKIGSLPFLEKLKLLSGFLKQRTWETNDEHFPSLKFLLIDGVYNLEHWSTESRHFPRLKHLVLRNLDKLKEISSEVGEIPTLESIHLEFCSNPSVLSAIRILEEQEDLGNTELHVRVLLRGRNRIPKNKALANFHVEVIPN